MWRHALLPQVALSSFLQILPMFFETSLSGSAACAARTVQLERDYFQFVSLHLK